MDERKPSRPSTSAAAAGAATRPGGAPPRTVTNPGGMRAMSAARAQPVAPAGAPVPAAIKERVKEEASNAALNVIAILRETWEDFRNSDRYFKYKAGIIAIWIALSVATFVIARPGVPAGIEAENELSARLVVARSGERTVYMLQNESDMAWTNVVVTANGRYAARVEALPARKDLAFTLDKFLGPDGKPAPSSLVVRELVLKTDEGAAELIEDGEVVR